MFSTEKHDWPDAAWQQLEEFVDDLHEQSRAPIDSGQFYRRLLEGCVTALAATAGAVWWREAPERWVVLYQTNLDAVVPRDDPTATSVHQTLLEQTGRSDQPCCYPPHSGAEPGTENPTDAVLAVCAVPADAAIVVELFLPVGQSPATQLGWQELLQTVCQIAADYHTWDEYRQLRSERDFHTQSLALLRRVQGRSDLRRTAYEIANEGRRLVEADRLSVLVRRSRDWRLLAVSGVDRIEPRADATKSLQQLADWAARWGEPLDYTDQSVADELPTELEDLVQRHIDQSQARSLVAAPLQLSPDSDEQPSRGDSSNRPSAVLIAEQFQVESGRLSRQRVIELAHLCEPALGQAMRLDRFGLRSVLRWSDRWSRLGWLKGLSRLSAVVLAVAALVATLVLVERDFEIAAPARLTPMVESDVFATADGAVAQVHVAHGDQVAQGDVLAVLDDPQLVLELERVRGEIDTTRKRQEAIAVARTDRQVREDTESESLTLSAEAQQLEQRMASLRRQEEILVARREALAIRSPIVGTVLTLDVQHLLDARPVTRGQVLFTVADTSAGWQLFANVPQARIGQVVAARQESSTPLPVRFRLAGDVEKTYVGSLASIRETAVFDTDGLEGELPAVEVLVAIDEDSLAAARPGMNAEVRIHCGRRSLGYVWLHDVWETVYSWITF